MKPAIFGVSALAAVLLGSVCVAADDAVKAQPGDSSNAVQAADGASKSEKSGNNAKPQAAGKGQARAARLTKPWKDMSSLSEEQKKQIADIHRKAVQDKNVIEEREKADIMALLNDSRRASSSRCRKRKPLRRRPRPPRRVRAPAARPTRRRQRTVRANRRLPGRAGSSASHGRIDTRSGPVHANEDPWGRAGAPPSHPPQAPRRPRVFTMRKPTGSDPWAFRLC